MREIEVKASVTDKQALLERLRAQDIAVSGSVSHHDRVFGLPGAGGGDARPWLRIRTEMKNGQRQDIFTLKKSLTNQLDSIEHETAVEDAMELEQIIKHLGFEPYSDLTKTRQTAHMGEIEICIDTVEGLGDFIEVEKLTDEAADFDAAERELWKVLESCGIKRDAQVFEGYDVLMRKSQGLTD